MPKCFVIQGFGEKTDLTNGRKLNLDASYRVIKKAVEAAGLECIRADEIVHSGSIDQVMYQSILDADLVIADLSTYNVNAAYELGVRYGVRPGATMIVAEDQFKNPFDVGHIVVRPYRHLGEDIGAQEAERFAKDLCDAIKQIMVKGEADSPIYTLLGLDPPKSKSAGARAPAALELPALEEPGQDKSAKVLLEQARAAMTASKFELASSLFAAIHALRPRDEYVVQQLALATYKSKLPDPMTALKTAHALLETLDPGITNNPETLGLWGAIHKRLWELMADRGHLDTAIDAYERGFYLKQDYYNGINLAYLFNVRAEVALKAGANAEAVTDFVLSKRIRRQVMRICEDALNAPAFAVNGSTSASSEVTEQKYWIAATLWEAAVGLEDLSAIDRWKAEATRVATAGWMLESTQSQLSKLEAMLKNSPLKIAGLQ